jgi:predicted HicB family RNase H-like nuclease
VNVTLSVDDEVIREARRRAEALGTSVNQLVREYLEHLAACGATRFFLA